MAPALLSFFFLNSVIFDFGPVTAALFCLTLASLFVGSLYVCASPKYGRDHPVKIKERFKRVFGVCILALLLLWFTATTSHLPKSRNILSWLGMRFSGFFSALVLPLILTQILFLGPLSLHYIDGICRLYADRNYWSSNLRNLVWLRNHVVGPLSEEFVFRACMLPVLVPSFGETTAIFLCPVFFGIAHLHHIYEKMKEGMSFKGAALRAALQFGYTTVFGIYSAFLFLRTGHLTAPVIAHAFCNHMGFPSFQEVIAQPSPTKYFVSAAFVIGLLLWTVLLFPLTDPSLFDNTLYYSIYSKQVSDDIVR